MEKQVYHLITALLLGAGVWIMARGDVISGSFAGLSTGTWLALAVIFPVVHQFYVVLLWRGELYFQWLSGRFGERGFLIWGIGFMILFLTRPVIVFALGIANQGTLMIPWWLNIPLIVFSSAILIYMAYSFVKYFGVKRALGMDHFKPEAYRNKSFVRQGIFRWSSNAMYTYAFLALWLIGLIFQSKAALLAAVFNPMFIWEHYYFTELQDRQYIHRSDSSCSVDDRGNFYLAGSVSFTSNK